MNLKIFIAVFISTINYCSSIQIYNESFSIQYNDDGLDLKENVRFFLYTNNKSSPEQLYVNDKHTLDKTAYYVSHPTKFVTHGWMSSYTSKSCKYVREALLKHGDYNVIVVDWKTIALQKYQEAGSRLRVIGNYVGKMIAFLQDQGASLERMSLIGHSLGAHIVGFAGKNLPKKNKVKHIVGLDPAGVGFQYLDANDKLSRDDAQNVQVIHTNMGQLAILGHVGHSDFYPNGGGPEQPGCLNLDGGNCAHKRSYKYYAESLENPKSWYAIECDTYDDFKDGKCKSNEIVPFPRWSGDYKAKYKNYMLRTNLHSPYGLGRNGTQPEN